MADTAHPFIAKMFEQLGHGDDADRSQAYAQLELEASLYLPAERQQILEAVDKAIADDESNRDDQGHAKQVGNLRGRAQLYNLRRAIVSGDQKLKLAGR